MQQMGLRAAYPKPQTSQPGKRHRIYPYLLRGLSITRPNQVWGSNTCSIPKAKGFMYLTVIMDWYSRQVLVWRLSNTLDAQPCLETLEEAFVRKGMPEIFNSHQGTQYTKEAFTAMLTTHGVKISLEGKGREATMCSSNAWGRV